MSTKKKTRNKKHNVHKIKDVVRWYNLHDAISSLDITIRKCAEGMLLLTAADVDNVLKNNGHSDDINKVSTLIVQYKDQLRYAIINLCKDRNAEVSEDDYPMYLEMFGKVNDIYTNFMTNVMPIFSDLSVTYEELTEDNKDEAEK